MAVPTVFLNGEVFRPGPHGRWKKSWPRSTPAPPNATAALAEKGVFDMLIVGGGPAGAAAAIYSARKGIRTGVVAERFGGQVLDTMGIENFISVKETDGPKLAVALEQHVKSYDVDIMNLQRAVGLVPGRIDRGQAGFRRQLESQVHRAGNRRALAQSGRAWRT
jgi:alkyl hydroperoxide reductase subunit F